MRMCVYDVARSGGWRSVCSHFGIALRQFSQFAMRAWKHLVFKWQTQFVLTPTQYSTAIYKFPLVTVTVHTLRFCLSISVCPLQPRAISYTICCHHALSCLQLGFPTHYVPLLLHATHTHSWYGLYPFHKMKMRCQWQGLCLCAAQIIDPTWIMSHLLTRCLSLSLFHSIAVVHEPSTPSPYNVYMHMKRGTEQTHWHKWYH